MRKYLYGFCAFVLAFAILSVSVLRSASVFPAYGFSPTSPSTFLTVTPTPTVNYFMPYPGKVLPDNWLWYVKAMRDRFQYTLTTDALKKADLALLFSDKRFSSSQTLFDDNKPDLGATTLAKGEKYLEISFADEEIARKANVNTNDFLIKLTNASLKHRQLIEEEILPKTPEDLRPEIVKLEDYSKNVYKNCRDILTSRGIVSPKDPFNGR